MPFDEQVFMKQACSSSVSECNEYVNILIYLCYFQYFLYVYVQIYQIYLFFFCFLDMNTIGYSYRNQYKCQTLYCLHSSKGEASDQNRSQLNTTLQPGHNSLSRKNIGKQKQKRKEKQNQATLQSVCISLCPKTQK